VAGRREVEVNERDRTVVTEDRVVRPGIVMADHLTPEVGCQRARGVMQVPQQRRCLPDLAVGEVLPSWSNVAGYERQDVTAVSVPAQVVGAAVEARLGEMSQQPRHERRRGRGRATYCLANPDHTRRQVPAA
jgi:hypothetical protein